MRKFDFLYPEEIYFLGGARDEQDGGREWADHFPPLEAAELFQRIRIDLTRLLSKPDLPPETRHKFQDHVQFLESRLVLLVQDLERERKALRPPDTVLGHGREEWERALTLVRLINLEEKYPDFAQRWKEKNFPFHSRGEPLHIRDIEANEYDCLRRAVGFMAGAEEELKEIRGDLFKKSNRVRKQSSISEEKRKRIEKAIMGRIKKLELFLIYRDMWFWLEEGNTPR